MDSFLRPIAISLALLISQGILQAMENGDDDPAELRVLARRDNAHNQQNQPVAAPAHNAIDIPAAINQRIYAIRRYTANTIPNNPEIVLGLTGLGYIGLAAVLHAPPERLGRSIDTFNHFSHNADLAVIEAFQNVPASQVLAFFFAGFGSVMLCPAAYAICQQVNRYIVPGNPDTHPAIARQVAARAAQEAVDSDDESDDKNAIKCAICISTIKANAPQISLICNHVFHRNCLAQWLTQIANNPRAHNCPTCRNNK